jgi:mRNA interferase MazF
MKPLSSQPAGPYQWGVFRIDLDPVVGHEQAGERPALVVSVEPINQRYSVVLVAPITSRKQNRQPRLGEVLIPAGTGGLPQESFVLCYQTRAIDRSRLKRKYGDITDNDIRRRITLMLADCLDIAQDTLPERDQASESS